MDVQEKTFIKTKLKNDINISAVYTIHYFKYGKNFKFTKEKHPFWELIYIDSGNATIVSDQNTYNLKQGEAFLHKPNEVHTVYTNEAFANSAIISFESKSRALHLLARNVLRLDEQEKTLLNNVIKEAKENYLDKLNDLNLVKMSKKPKISFGSDQIIKNCTELLFISLLREQKNAKSSILKEIKKEHSSFVQNALAIMNEKLENAEQLSLLDIAKSTGYSISYVKTKFKAEIGVSVIQYYVSLKMEKAKFLIAQGGHSITEISDLLGFNSVHYFCRQFKINTGMSPTEYLHSIKAENLL